MTHYIDAKILIAEIERYENTAIEAYNPHGEDADFWYGKVVACEDLKTLVTSLQQEQPEVDIEKAIKDELPPMTDDEELGLCICDHLGNHRVTVKDIHEIARHFYELGRNARKEE